MPETDVSLRSWTRPRPAWAEVALPGEALLLAERHDRVFFGRLADADRGVGAWDAAHAFTDAWHVRWRRLGARVRVVACGPAPALDPLGAPDAQKDLSGMDREERHHVLWGRRNAGEAFWLELRLPHVMRAPHLHPAGHDGPDGEMLRRLLTAEVFRDPDTGAAVYERYRGLAYAATDDDGQALDVLGA